ncbi:TPA: hypothetical protein N8G14_003115 [Escherichia coli]|nr:hypothetical protein [Escherichia coli]HCO3830400.1 hypothetical protein [Escherichia coli]HCO3840471.1 hypothetical protein [Escherichia coli]HCO3969352.1 hypothetical protein [Escherichia coli]
MDANHIDHSEDWSKIESILELSMRASSISQKFYSLEQQKKADDLARFLMLSSLTTAPLDRDCVSALLNGTKLWEKNGKPVSISNGISLEYLEECCLVMFEADLLLITCNLESNIVNLVDDSLIPVIETIIALRNIQHGLNGYEKPHLSVTKEIWEREFNGGASLLDCVEKEGDLYVLNDNENNINRLVSTFLWQKVLASSSSPKDAFEKWLRIMRLTCETAFPVLQCATSDVEFKAYTDELQKHLLEIPSPKDLMRSLLNRTYFSDSVRNHTKIMEINSSSSEKYVSQPRRDVVTKSSLPSYNAHQYQTNKNEFSQIRNYSESRPYGERIGGFYKWLINDLLGESIVINNNSLIYPRSLIDLIRFSLTHPLLKHLFISELFQYYLSPKYFCFLLSIEETCNFAIFFLSEFYHEISTQIKNIDITEALAVLISKKYVKINGVNNDCDDGFLHIILVLTDKLSLYQADFKHSCHYTLCDNFLKHQHPKKILSMIDTIERVDLSAHCYANSSVFNLRNDKYFLLWWAYDFIEKNALDTTQQYISKLVSLITNELEKDLALSLEGKKTNLNASLLIRQFPWYKLAFEDNIERLLSISKRHKTDWSAALLFASKYQYNAKGAIRCYLQILMEIANHESCQDLMKLHKRIMSIADHIGFATEERDGVFRSIALNDYDLWPDFCVYINKVDHSDFENFLDSNEVTLTNSQLFQLMEACIHPAKKELIKSAIAALALDNIEKSSLDDLEKTFLSAYRSSEFELAMTVLNQANIELNEGRFKEQRHHHFAEKRQLIKCYQYKLMVTLLAVNQDEYDANFKLKIDATIIPFEPKERKYYMECEYFKRYYLAYYLINNDTNESIRILEGLIQDTNNPEYILMLLHANLANYHEVSNITLVRSTLSKVEQSANEQWSAISNYPLSWIAGILNAYLTIDDVSKMVSVWGLLSSAQKIIPQLLAPYCELLLRHNLVKEADIAFSAYMRFLGKEENLPKKLEGIARDIINAFAGEHPVTEYIDRIAENNQRSPEQLANSFRIINGSDAETYVKIVSNSTVDEYLVKAVTAVSKELLSRNKNIYIPIKDDTSSTGYSSKPANEDRINQWFCSLFNMREKNSPFHIKDQTQIGSSPSGKSYGEIDGVIVDSSQNKRIALFEAFRLLVWGTTPIDEHMDKLAGYDQEVFDIIFVVVYVFDKDFSTILNKYKTHIKSREYRGFTKENGYSLETVNGEDSDTFWMGKEKRQRGNANVSIYHIVINFYCETHD